MKKILIVEDDNLIAELERDYLESEYFATEICGEGTKVLEKNFDDYNLILLDVMLPGTDGFDLCKKIRSVSNVPIIFVTAKQGDVDKIDGLGLGADDYIVKPFNPSELVARVKCHIEIHKRLLSGEPDSKNSGDEIECGDLRIAVPSHLVFVRGSEVVLKNKEFDLLLFLASNPGVVLSKEDILENVWGMDSINDTATVMVHINRLREKIEENPSQPKHIVTVWGVGYRFDF